MENNPLFVALLTFIITSIRDYFMDKSKQKANEQHQIDCLKLALKKELQTIQALYYQLKLSDEPPKDGDDIKIISLQSHYTTVYEKNADKIGMLEPETAEAIVTAYTYIAAFMDTLRVYGQRWEAMIAYERTDQKAYWEYYMNDVKRCYTFAMDEEKVARDVIANAIDKLS